MWDRHMDRDSGEDDSLGWVWAIGMIALCFIWLGHLTLTAKEQKMDNSKKEAAMAILAEAAELDLRIQGRMRLKERFEELKERQIALQREIASKAKSTEEINKIAMQLSIDVAKLEKDMDEYQKSNGNNE